ncbi:Rrf2 family transcriptional regulator [Phosphitispora sp. TUW77]|uniref:Rrf2 family transcriptional regulator n=1 Tax=Phosphitispora sp. TUW77 TaxID=3152361 RepID=UPI003AB6ECCE
MQLTYIQQEIMGILRRADASYANPVSSAQISKALNVTPSYVREQGKFLCDGGLVQVRRGPGGGYFLNRERED